jgi:hypothetical protein
MRYPSRVAAHADDASDIDGLLNETVVGTVANRPDGGGDVDHGHRRGVDGLDRFD